MREVISVLIESIIHKFAPNETHLSMRKNIASLFMGSQFPTGGAASSEIAPSNPYYSLINIYILESS